MIDMDNIKQNCGVGFRDGTVFRPNSGDAVAILPYPSKPVTGFRRPLEAANLELSGYLQV